MKTNQKIKSLQLKVIQNIIRLHEDSILLFKNRRYSSAYFISAISLEELGKLFMTDDFLYHLGDKYADKKNLETLLLKNIYSHSRKQKWFAGNFRDILPTKFLLRIYNDDWESIKQKHLYVGFRKSHNKVHFESPIDTPTKSNRKLVENQITVINEVLIYLCVGLFIQALMISYLSYKDYNRIISIDLIENLLDNWRKRGKESKKYYANYLKEYKRVKRLPTEEYIKWRE